MLTVAVSNIVYDTVKYNRLKKRDIDMRANIPAADLPEAMTVKVSPPCDESDLEHDIHRAVERDWLVDGFDYQVIKPFKSEVFNAVTKCRADGEPSWEAKFVAMAAAKGRTIPPELL